MNPSTILPSASLHFREGSSDKVYHVAVEARDDGYVVTFAYGRRGSTLTTGMKSDVPVPLATAAKAFDKLVASKLAKGYKPDGQTTVPYEQTGTEGADSGIRCQLLNPVEKTALRGLISDRTHCLQQKFDGRRLLVRKQGDTVTGINRRGLVIAIPDVIREAVAGLPHDALIDGEAVGDTLHAFDLLELKGNCLRNTPYVSRLAGLIRLIPSNEPALRWVKSAIEPRDKLVLFDELKDAGCEGVVFKDSQASFTPGRPNSGGSQLKYKFVESASFVVTGVNSKRSVSLGLHNGDTLVAAGNVTISANHGIPQVGKVVEVSYLYAFRESGAVYQPVYAGERDDIPAADCTTDQLKYKTESAAA